MTKRPYPHQLDSVWVATDRDGYVAAFVTAGIGPIPIVFLNSNSPLAEEAENAISRMNSVTDANIIVTVPKPDSYIAIAKKGIFVYDWNDIHRTKNRRINVYEQVATPKKPAFIKELPQSLVQLASEVKFDNLAFSDSKTVDVLKLFASEKGD